MGEQFVLIGIQVLEKIGNMVEVILEVKKEMNLINGMIGKDQVKKVIRYIWDINEEKEIFIEYKYILYIYISSYMYLNVFWFVLIIKPFVTNVFRLILSVSSFKLFIAGLGSIDNKCVNISLILCVLCLLIFKYFTT